MNACKKYGPVLVTTLVLAACGGGSGSGGLDGGLGGGAGETAPTVAIDETNALDLAVAATEGAGQAVRSDDLPTTAPFGAVGTNSALVARQRQILECSNIDGGAGTVVYDFAQSGESFSIVYNCSSITGSYTGAFTPNAQNWTNFTASYDNFTVNGTNFNGSISCTRSSGESFDISCSYGLNGIEGLTGSTYSITNSTVSGDDTSGYNVTATVTDPSLGAVDYSATNIIYSNCQYDVPSSGSIFMNGNNGTQAVVTFNDCNSFTVSVGGGAVTTYNWSDIATINP